MPKYKFGKVVRPIPLEIFGKLIERVKVVDRSGYSVLFVQSLLAVFYWTGYRRSEVIGDKGLKYYVRDPKNRGKRVLKVEPPFPGMLKENMWLRTDNEESPIVLAYIYQVARKHGDRNDPWIFPVASTPFVDLIVEQWKKTESGQRIWPIASVTMWRVFKRVDPKLYAHFFGFNRITKMANDRRNSLGDIVQQTGKDPKTVGIYIARSGRNSQEISERVASEH